MLVFSNKMKRTLKFVLLFSHLFVLKLINNYCNQMLRSRHKKRQEYIILIVFLHFVMEDTSKYESN